MQFLKNFDKLALSFDGKEYSFGDLLRHSDDFSRVLDGLIGVKNSVGAIGDRVAIVCENCPEWAFSFYGIWRAGAVAVPVDFMSTSEEISYILDDCTPAAVFVSGKTEGVMTEFCG